MKRGKFLKGASVGGLMAWNPLPVMPGFAGDNERNRKQLYPRNRIRPVEDRPLPGADVV